MTFSPLYDTFISQLNRQFGWVSGEAGELLKHTYLRQAADGRTLAMARLRNLGEIDWALLGDGDGIDGSPINYHGYTEEELTVTLTFRLHLDANEVISGKGERAIYNAMGLVGYISPRRIAGEYQSRMPHSLRRLFSLMAERLPCYEVYYSYQYGAYVEIEVREAKIGRIRQPSRFLDAFARKLSRWLVELERLS